MVERRDLVSLAQLKRGLERQDGQAGPVRSGARRAFAARNVPVLYLESELETELSAQTVTRVEAFVEMLSTERRPA